MSDLNTRITEGLNRCTREQKLMILDFISLVTSEASKPTIFNAPKEEKDVFNITDLVGETPEPEYDNTGDKDGDGVEDEDYDEDIEDDDYDEDELDMNVKVDDVEDDTDYDEDDEDDEDSDEDDESEYDDDANEEEVIKSKKVKKAKDKYDFDTESEEDEEVFDADDEDDDYDEDEEDEDEDSDEDDESEYDEDDEEEDDEDDEDYDPSTYTPKAKSLKGKVKNVKIAKKGKKEHKKIKAPVKVKRVAFDESDYSTWTGNYPKVKKYAKEIGINVKEYFTGDEDEDIKFVKKAEKQIDKYSASLEKKSLSSLIKLLDKADLNVRGRTDNTRKQYAIEDLVATYIEENFG